MSKFLAVLISTLFLFGLAAPTQANTGPKTEQATPLMAHAAKGPGRWTHRKRKVVYAMARSLAKEKCKAERIILDSGPYLNCKHWYADGTPGWGSGPCYFYDRTGTAACVPFATLKNYKYGKVPGDAGNYLYLNFTTWQNGGVGYAKTSQGIIYQAFDPIWTMSKSAPTA